MLLEQWMRVIDNTRCERVYTTPKAETNVSSDELSRWRSTADDLIAADLQGGHDLEKCLSKLKTQNIVVHSETFWHFFFVGLAVLF